MNTQESTLDGTYDGTYDEQVAIVTGGARGLGRACALELARRGARVVVADYFVGEDGVAAAQLVVDEIEAASGAAVASTANVATFDGAQSIVDLAVSTYGRLDFLITCAGNFNPARITDIDQDVWDAITGVHLDGHLACLTAATRQMIEQGEGGRVVTVSSRGGLFGAEVAYSGAKAGIMGLTSAAARELAEHGITVNCLLPSAQTQLFKSAAETRLFGGMPVSLHMEPDYIAPLVAYLCLPAAAGITGRFLYASGSDICAYAPPLLVENTTTFVRTSDRWTVEGLAEYLPALLGI